LVILNLGLDMQGSNDVGFAIRSTRWHRTVILSLMLAAAPASAQNRPNPTNPNPTSRTNPASPASQANSSEVAVPPIECWWKTDRSAVRVGEQFALTLTCAILDTDRVRVVVDESGLAPSALHLVPFDIVDGQRFRDVPNSPRRFFQYRYTMRVLGEEFFGKEITLPRLQISYRVQNALQGGAALQGRETQYSLVPVPIRVLSLVPADATDIRDTPLETFGDVEARLFRSNLLLILAAVAFAFAILVAVMIVARETVKRRAATALRRRAMSPTSVLRAASRELADVRSASQRDGWNSDLAGRAAAALRLAGAVQLSRPVSERQVDRGTALSEGQVVAAPGLGLLRGKKTVLSAAVTPDTNGLDGQGGSASPLWRSLSQTLGVFTAARYSRNGELDGVALDGALAEGQDAVKRLRVAQWLRIPRSRRHHEETEATRQSWAR
jgi:hypothetical protein